MNNKNTSKIQNYLSNFVKILVINKEPFNPLTYSYKSYEQTYELYQNTSLNWRTCR